MKEFLKEQLKSQGEYSDEWTVWDYTEDVNEDANSNDWLENNTSYVYRVATLCAIDRNKCDWLDIAIGTQRSEGADFELTGILRFKRGENDDIGRVLKRAMECLKYSHPVFDDL